MRFDERLAARRLGELARAAIPPRLERRYRASGAFRRRIHGLLRWSWAIVLGWLFVFGDNGLASIAFRWTRIQTLEREVAALERREALLRSEVARREKDPATLERLARERYGMARPGETVYRIVEVTPAEARRLARAQREILKRQEAALATAADTRRSTRPPVTRSGH